MGFWRGMKSFAFVEIVSRERNSPSSPLQQSVHAETKLESI
jgi:hypothetical protein